MSVPGTTGRTLVVSPRSSYIRPITGLTGFSLTCEMILLLFNRSWGSYNSAQVILHWVSCTSAATWYSVEPQTIRK